MRHLVPLLVLVAGCPPKPEPVQEPVAQPEPEPRTMPGPLEVPDFEMPDTETRTLSNGLQVIVATHDEVPLFEVRLVTNTGGYLDPEGKEGLASVTFDLLDDGAGDLTSEEIARQLKQLGSDIDTFADVDSGYVSASGLVRNLEPTLALWATVLTEPTFPQEEWEILQKRRIANVIAEREDPDSVARNVSYQVLYGETYRGRLADEESYAALTPADMRGFYEAWVGPENAVVLVGGDVTADEIVPLLEEHLGDWKPEVTEAFPSGDLEMPEEAHLYFVDEEDAAQSVVRVLTPIGTRLDEAYFPFFMANQALGGSFTSRVNLNLREDKGYTYGARCFIGQWDGPGVWGCATSVQTEVTGPAMEELRKEIRDALADRPLAEEEIAYFKSRQVNAFPGSYETTGAIIGEQQTIWRYGLPEDWPEQFLPRIEAVSPEAANQALKGWIEPDRLLWFVVGDKDEVWDDLQAFGLPITELDSSGVPVQAEPEQGG